MRLKLHPVWRAERRPPPVSLSDVHVAEILACLNMLSFQIDEAGMKIAWGFYLRFLRSELPVALRGYHKATRTEARVVEHFERVWGRPEGVGRDRRAVYRIRGRPYSGVSSTLLYRISMDSVLAVAQAVQARSILEVGTGDGFNLGLLVEGGFKGTLAGVDITATGLGAADRNLRKARAGEPSAPSFIQCNALALPFKDASYDLVFTHLCLEQLPRVATHAIGELSRVARHVVVCIEWFTMLQGWLERRWVRFQDYYCGELSDYVGANLWPVAVFRFPLQKLNLNLGMGVFAPVKESMRAR